MYENEGGALSKSSLNSKIFTDCIQSEFAQRSTRSTRPRRKINNVVDYRIPDIPFSTVEQQDTNRQNKVKKLIEKFEIHQHKESFFQDLGQQKINKFSKGSQDLIADMNSAEIFELYVLQKAMSRLQYLGNEHYLSQLWKKIQIFTETKRVRKEQLRRLNPRTCCTQTEVAQWSTRSTRTRRKNIL